MGSSPRAGHRNFGVRELAPAFGGRSLLRPTKAGSTRPPDSPGQGSLRSEPAPTDKAGASSRTPKGGGIPSRALLVAAGARPPGGTEDGPGRPGFPPDARKRLKAHLRSAELESTAPSGCERAETSTMPADSGEVEGG